jgi:hypothetical protein
MSTIHERVTVWTAVCLVCGLAACAPIATTPSEGIDCLEAEQVENRSEEALDGHEQGTRLQGTRLQGNTHQGRTGQGSANQGNVNQGNVNQGATNRGGAHQGSQPTPLDPTQRAALLQALDGVHLRPAGSDDAEILLHDGVLLDADGVEVSGPVQALTADASTLFLGITPVRSGPDDTRYDVRHAGASVCVEGELGRFVPGTWDATGRHIAGPDAVTFACDSGVIAKCVVWGYAPWSVGEELHQTCTRLARADYCGNGESWTRENTLINLYDTLNIQIPEPAPELSFEAAWGPGGARCVSRPRYILTTADGSELLPSCWNALPPCDAKTWQATGASIANDSAHAPVACD